MRAGGVLELEARRHLDDARADVDRRDPAERRAVDVHVAAEPARLVEEVERLALQLARGSGCT